jgi:molybdopterin biosynthesis enzyme MoaB
MVSSSTPARRQAATRGALAVGFVGLGPDGARLADEAAALVTAAWARHAAVTVRTRGAGDDAEALARTLRAWCDRERLDAVFTVGRAGHLPGDFAPGTTEALLERRLPGIEERMHLCGRGTPESLLSRGRAGVRRGTLVVNLPARAARIREIAAFLAPVVVHAVAKARGDGGDCGGAAAGR